MHIIRLRGPWQLEPLARYVERPGGYDRSAADLPPGGKATMPADWSAGLRTGLLGNRSLSPHVPKTNRPGAGRPGVAGDRAAALERVCVSRRATAR